IYRSQFTNNTAQNPTFGYGGAIWAGEDTEMYVRNSVFLNNIAHFGGAIYASPNAVVTLDGSVPRPPAPNKLQFNGNRATEDGGAVYNAGGTLTITNALLTANSTPTDALLAGFGGATLYAGHLHVTHSDPRGDC